MGYFSNVDLELQDDERPRANYIRYWRKGTPIRIDAPGQGIHEFIGEVAEDGPETGLVLVDLLYAHRRVPGAWLRLDTEVRA